MATPKKQSVKLPRAPLIFVLAQVRFSPVLKMESYVPDIQEYMRHHGFPKYRVETIQNIMIGSGTKTEVTRRWIFDDAESCRQVILTTDALTFQTTTYDTFDGFVSDFTTVAQPLADHAKVERIEQIGLRYVDLLTPIDGISTGELLRPGLRGVPAASLGSENMVFSFALQAQTPPGVLTVRSIQLLNIESLLPPDLGEVSLAFPKWALKAQDTRVLDFDHISRTNLSFSGASLSQELGELHKYTDMAFRSFVTEEAFQAWSLPG